MRRRQLDPSFQSRGRGGGSRQEPSLALAFRALTNEWSTCWASFPPPSTGPKSASQCRYVSEDVRVLQDCVSQLTPVVVLPEKCKCCRNWVCAKKSGRPTTTVDFDVGGGVVGQLWWWWGGSSSFKPVSPAGSPLCLSTQSFICSKLIPRKGLYTCPHHCKASMWNQTWKSAFLTRRPHGHGVEMVQLVQFFCRQCETNLIEDKVRLRDTILYFALSVVSSVVSWGTLSI